MEVQMMHRNKITKLKAHTFFPVWVRQRELRQRLPLGHSDTFYKSLYSSISPCHSWGGGELTYAQGIFSLGFSPDGTLLVAGCENSIRLFDPLSRRLIRSVSNMHERTVRHVKFLNSRIFVTGSVRGLVSLWDTRNLKKRYQTLKHSNMIANVEYSKNKEFLITSCVAGPIYLWNTSNWIPNVASNTFTSHYLEHLRLSPDETKMIISTNNGYLLIVHDIDLITLAQDLDEFVMEKFESESLLPANTAAGWHSSRCVFPERPRNRVEVVADFPNAVGCNQVTALEIHPQGWSVFSSIGTSESDWTCVHDIQEKSSKRRAASRRVRERRSGSPADTASTPPADTLEQAGFESNPSSSRALDPSFPRPNSSVAQFNPTDNERCPRLTHYIEEPYKEWYSDSLSASADGRLLCSPFDNSFRLLAFSPECSEQSVSWCGTNPSRLHELSSHIAHSESIVCTKFSPHHCLLVSGCIDGQLTWYQPVV